ncbi:MAG: Ig-like domain-containing protein, partial [Anaerolineaceae bacterium]
MLVLAAVTLFLFTPRISYFNAENSVIGLGESTTLRWRAFFFTHDLSISGINEPIKSSSGEMEIFPTETVNTYQLTATTWLWKMLNLSPKQASFTVLAVPSEPSINTFVVGDNDVLVGDYVLLRWSVSNAKKVLLTINGVTDVFENPEDFNGERNLFITADTLVSIEAINALGTVVDSEYILAQPPSIVIKKFEVNKTSIYKGEQVTIIWEIDGVGMADGGQVMISAFDSVLPLEGELTFFPEESMEFVLTVTNRKAKEVRILPVGVLDPAAPPAAPTINFFTAAPETLVGGGKVELAWSVTGVFQTLTITNGKETIASGLGAQGFRTIDVKESGTYVLTAVNADKSAGKELTITVNPAKLEAVLSITSVDLPTAAMIGSKAIVGISCESPNAEDPPPTGTVIISDGTASCPISLPVTSCELEFKTPGNKVLTATYMGDDNYIQSESDPWSGSLVSVMGNDLTLQLSFVPSSGPFYFGQKVDLKVFAIGSNPIRNPLGTIMLKRVCDPAANYLETCAAVQEGLYTLKAEDGG